MYGSECTSTTWLHVLCNVFNNNMRFHKSYHDIALRYPTIRLLYCSSNMCPRSSDWLYFSSWVSKRQQILAPNWQQMWSADPDYNKIMNSTNWHFTCAVLTCFAHLNPREREIFRHYTHTCMFKYVKLIY